jgi:hypothetical protein
MSVLLIQSKRAIDSLQILYFPFVELGFGGGTHPSQEI